MKLKGHKKHHNLGESDDFHLHPNQTALHYSAGRKKKFITIGLVAVSLLILAGAAAWFYMSASEQAREGQQAGGTNSQTPAAGDIEPAELSESYSSRDLRVDFNYPDSWQVNEGAGGVRIESQQFSFDTVDVGQVEGHFRLYIRIQARENDSNYIGRGVAIEPSRQISYDQPQPGQREQTLLTAFGQDEMDNFNFFLVSGGFDLSAGDTLGPDFGTEPGAYIIVGGYSSPELSEDLQMYKVPTQNYSDTAQYQEAVSIVKSLKIR